MPETPKSPLQKLHELWMEARGNAIWEAVMAALGILLWLFLHLPPWMVLTGCAIASLFLCVATSRLEQGWKERFRRSWWIGVIALAGSGLVCWRVIRDSRPDSSSPPASAIVNVSGNNNTTIQAGPGAVVNNGPKKSEVEDAFRKIATEVMAKKQEEQGPALAKDFPFGYALFSMSSSRKEIIPFAGYEGQPLFLQWTNSYAESSGDMITVHLPSLFLEGEIISDNAVSLPRMKGANLTMDFGGVKAGLFSGNQITGGPGPGDQHWAVGPDPKYSLTVRLIEIQDEILVAALGLKPFEGKRPGP